MPWQVCIHKIDVLKAMSKDKESDTAVLLASCKTMSAFAFEKIVTKKGILRTSIGAAHKGWTIQEPEALRALVRGTESSSVLRFSRRTLGHVSYASLMLSGFASSSSSLACLSGIDTMLYIPLGYVLVYYYIIPCIYI